MDCTSESRKLVPLSKVVSASILDSYEDIGKTEQVYSHWASRGLKKLQSESLSHGLKKVLITINGNTHTGTLPLDFDEETFVGIIDNMGRKVAMKLNNNISDSKNVETISCDDTKCPKCSQDTSICNDLAITQETNLIVINSNTYEQTIIKKLYPNGDYYLETSTPVLNIDTNGVDYALKKEFIVNFDLKPCGCLETTPANIATLQCYCPDIYCNYYAPCDNSCSTNYGSYRIFEESGLIQFDSHFKFSQVYMEYKGFIPKVRGQYQVPQVAFETLVEWTKFKSVANRKNITSVEKNWYLQNYIRERRNMERVIGRFSLSQIMQAALLLPKFDFDYNWYDCFCTTSTVATPVATTTVAVTAATPATDCCVTTTIINRTAFTLAVKVDGGVGHPVAGQTTYQNNVLKGATDINYILIAKTVETILDGDFTFDAVAGSIDRSPNIWQTDDTLIINYNKDV